MSFLYDHRMQQLTPADKANDGLFSAFSMQSWWDTVTKVYHRVVTAPRTGTGRESENCLGSMAQSRLNVKVWRRQRGRDIETICAQGYDLNALTKLKLSTNALLFPCSSSTCLVLNGSDVTASFILMLGTP
jgi:hypothetical protein